jgi:hypothetical protein
MLIIVLAKESLTEYISEISATYTGVGLLGMMVGISAHDDMTMRFSIL